MSEDLKTCGEFNCDKCNDRFFKLQKELKHMKEQAYQNQPYYYEEWQVEFEENKRLKKQHDMDTECIERIRSKAYQLEAEALQLREFVQEVSEEPCGDWCRNDECSSCKAKQILTATPRTAALAELVEAVKSYSYYRESGLPIDGIIDKLEDNIHEAYFRWQEMK